MLISWRRRQSLYLWRNPLETVGEIIMIDKLEKLLASLQHCGGQRLSAKRKMDTDSRVWNSAIPRSVQERMIGMRHIGSFH